MSSGPGRPESRPPATRLTFVQAAYELHRKYILISAAEELEDALVDGPDEATLHLRLDEQIVEMIESVQRHGLFEYAPGLLAPTRPMLGASNARNRRYVDDTHVDPTDPGSYTSHALHDISPGARMLIALELFDLVDRPGEQALDALSVLEWLTAQITAGSRLVWLDRCEPHLDLAATDEALRAHVADAARGIMALIETTRAAPPVAIERIGVAFAFGAGAGWAYANANMDEVVEQIADTLGRQPTEQEVTRGIVALGIGMAHQHFSDDEDALRRCAHELFGDA